MAALGVIPLTPVGRIGECREGCGACCESIRLQIPPNYKTDPDVKNWIELHGIAVITVGEATYAVINRPCVALNPDKSCSLYGTSARPQLCSEWPATPAAMTGLEDQCSYEFRERDQ